MKFLCILLHLVFSVSFFARELRAAPNVPPTSIHELLVTQIDGKEISLSQFKGSVVMVVNTASKCGFTAQYKELQELYEKFRPQGFAVLGFPSNDFLNQEPGSNDEIQEFCKKTYHVTFPLFARNPVTGNTKQPLFKFLTEQSGDLLSGEVKWNFEKFLIDRDGKLRARFGSFTTPMGSRITDTLEELLAEKIPAQERP